MRSFVGLLQRHARAWLAVACTALCVPGLDSAGAEPVVPPQRLCPIVIRIPEHVLNEGAAPIIEQSPVELCVLGVQNRGTAHVQGELLVDFAHSPKYAALQLAFTGTSTSRTTARQGPAVIHSTTTSNFQCRAPLWFDEAVGFTAGDPQVQVDIASMQRRVSTSAPGLRGRIVRSVAEKRITENQGKIRQITLTTSRTRLSGSMDQRVEQRIAAWNEHWLGLREALQRQRWYVDLPSPLFATTDDELIIVFAPDSEAAAYGVKHGVPVDLLPVSDPASVGSILLHEAWLEQAQDSDGIAEYLATMPQTLMVLMAHEMTLRVETTVVDGWNFFQFYDK